MSSNMKTIFTFIVLSLVSCVIGYEVKSVSVYEGESVTLQTDTEILKDDKIYWRFREVNVIFLVQMIVYRVSYVGFTDTRFKDRLLISNTLTGDLTIKNMRIKHTGLYEAEIYDGTGTLYKRFNVIVKESASELTTDKVKSVSVMAGDSVTLQTDLTDIQRDAFILWRFGDESVFIAKCDKENNEISYGDDGRFKDRLMLNDQTGDLTITNFINSNAGVYKLKISSNKEIIDKTFSVSLTGMTSGVIAGLCVFFLLIIAAVIAAGVILHHRKISELKNQLEKIKLAELGSSVTLDTGVTKIQKDDEIQWRFGPEDTVIAQITGGTDNPLYNFTDGRFSCVMQMNKQTGSLTITDITVKHSGVYKLKICSGKKTDYKKYNVFILVSVKEGESVTLKTESKIQRGDQVEWSLKGDQLKWSKTDEIILITGLNGDDSKTLYIVDWIHKDRLKMNALTGDLNITDVKKSDAGFYTLQLIDTDGKITYIKFSLCVLASAGVSGNEAAMIEMPLLK